MKKIYLVILGMIISNLAISQFSNIVFNDVFSTDSTYAWVVGSNGTIIKITDGGQSYDNYSYDTDLSLNSIYFTNNQNGFIVGDSGIVLKTTNGGYTWDLIDLGFFHSFSSVSFVDDQSGWISVVPNQGSGFFKTLNGGNDWIYLDHFIFNTFFLDANLGWGISSEMTGKVIHKTHDGGLTWDSISNSTGTSYPTLCFIDPLEGLKIVRAYGNCFLYKTNDGGINWVTTILGDEGLSLDNICYIDAQNVWVYGSRNIFYSSDYFDTYNIFQSDEWYTDICISGYSNGWAVSHNQITEQNTIWKLDGINDWIKIEFLGLDEFAEDEIKLSCHPNPTNNTTLISFKSSKEKGVLISISNIKGQLIKQINIGNKKAGSYELDCSNYSRGVYFIRLKSGSGILTEKLIIK